MMAEVRLKILFCVVFICALSPLHGQNQNSLQLDNYSGIQGSMQFPTHGLSNPLPWNAHLIGSHINFATNFGFLENVNLTKLGNYTLEQEANLDTAPGGPDQRVVRYGDGPFYAFLSMDNLGPSFQMKKKIFGQITTLGVFTRHRFELSTSGLDSGFNYDNFLEENYSIPIDINEGNLALMNWLEFGFNAAREFKQVGSTTVEAGVNLKYIYALDAAYIRHQFSDLVNRQDTLFVRSASAVAGYKTSYNSDKESYGIKKQGGGWGLDLGITLKKFNRPENRNFYPNQYDYKFSASITDLGFARFNGNRHAFIGSPNVDIEESVFDDVENPEQFFQSLSDAFYGTPNQSQLQEGVFFIGLPTAVNLHYDQRLHDHWFAGATFVQRLPLYANSLKKINQLNINGRFEKNWFGAGTSLSLREYQDFGLGFSLRAGPFYMGTDDFIPVFAEQKKVNSANFYFGFRIYPWKWTVEKARTKEDCSCL